MEREAGVERDSQILDPDTNQAGRATPFETPPRGFGKRAAGPDRAVYVAAALALTEPGPAAAGLVVTDQQGRVLAQRSQYVGHSTKREAVAQALLTAMRLAITGGLEAPTFRIDDAVLADALQGREQVTDRTSQLVPMIREQMAQLPDHTIEVVPTSQNLARAVALVPLVEWLPERTQRAQPLPVRSLGNGVYEVESERHPGQTYRVTLRAPDDSGDGEPLQCECADFLYRNIPCKHLLAAAREAGGVERLFYSDAER